MDYKKVRTVFTLQEKVYPSCKVHQMECIGKEDYTDETEFSVIIRWVIS